MKLADLSLETLEQTNAVRWDRIIEGVEFEADLGDLDAERGEVEMACGEELVDVSLRQLRTRLSFEPGRY